jgi:hypothetical protein
MESIAATQVMAQFVVLSVRSRHARNLAPIVVRDEIDKFLRRAGKHRCRGSGLEIMRRMSSLQL